MSIACFILAFYLWWWWWFLGEIKKAPLLDENEREIEPEINKGKEKNLKMPGK